MKIERREFLKLGAAVAVGLGGGLTLDVLTKTKPAAAETRTDVAGTRVSSKALHAKRWAMVVDASKFKTEEDFRRVKEACVKAHNIPDFGPDSKHQIKWIWEEPFERTFYGVDDPYLPEAIKKENFPVMCNHCENPPCVRVCPTQATFKRPDGIVGMDYHRCIGCRFCMAACPFGARSFNFVDPRPYIKDINPDFPTRTKGVVEKCNFCMERLDQGLMPVCVEASNGALVFGDLDDPTSDVRKILDTHYAIRRKPELGTGPSVFYLVGGGGAGA
ncbi:Twin-arginine translocation pathway, signal sequence, bacterial/archaeal [Acididesulfobacillus acetoxydans]|uniref:Hdr-like menaquinol oxidoreductase iron-sulfur subunit 1 n=1 Tax=Acididesulfobacillus acetoxydans TaxID=1561005 RepID=A0A8S0XAK9_9FIRM|nr:4Fe-4S dicluster domain-containing protein [Acididesulfobacillus acetoxydans]CAA7600026.1 Twin-arginine translocation pathway, signal sequence, bacterial/archaeal [Acididesulfobacillus acetoxydans]CEJ07801.1 Hdr-like menaquinol oxidoreductase iron-sulfur subunit 1 [Acididesulfobacillus acetoxydans]